MVLNALLCLLMAVGVTQPGGAGTQIYIYDNASAANATYYTFAEISTAFPADFVSNGTTPASYRSAVDLQIGDVGSGTAATTLQDTGVTVFFAANRCLFTRATQASSWSTLLGTKVGSGNQATGRSGCNIYASPSVPRTLRGTIKCYGCTFVIHSTNFNWSFIPAVAGTGSELDNCLFDCRGNGTFVLGTVASIGFSSIYSVYMTASGTGNVLGNVGADSIERITLGTTTGAFCLSATPPTGTIKDVSLFGSPVTAQISLSATGWNIARPIWISGVKKIVDGTFAINSINEMWAWQPLVVDGSGTPVSGIPVKMTDVFGAVIVNTTSGSDGRVTFGTGQTANMVTVLDYYGVAGITTSRQHGPFLVEVNTGAGRNSAWPSLRYYFSWPNAAACTNLVGQLDDFGDAIPLAYAAGAPTTWVEVVAP